MAPVIKTLKDMAHKAFAAVEDTFELELPSPTLTSPPPPPKIGGTVSAALSVAKVAQAPPRIHVSNLQRAAGGQNLLRFLSNLGKTDLAMTYPPWTVDTFERIGTQRTPVL